MLMGRGRRPPLTPVSPPMLVRYLFGLAVDPDVAEGGLGVPSSLLGGLTGCCSWLCVRARSANTSSSSAFRDRNSSICATRSPFSSRSCCKSRRSDSVSAVQGLDLSFPTCAFGFDNFLLRFDLVVPTSKLFYLSIHSRHSLTLTRNHPTHSCFPLSLQLQNFILRIFQI